MKTLTVVGQVRDEEGAQGLCIDSFVTFRESVIARNEVETDIEAEVGPWEKEMECDEAFFRVFGGWDPRSCSGNELVMDSSGVPST